MTRAFLPWMLFLCLIALPAAGQEATEPLKTNIPEEMLIGTPPDTLVMLFPDLELLSPDKLPKIEVPKGTVNLALNKPVTASDDQPMLGKLAFVTDGRKEGASDTYVELIPGLQWVQIDLEKPSKIYAVYVWHFFREARSYQDVIIRTADDAEFTQNVQTIYNNDQDNSAGLGIGKGRPYIETNLGNVFDAKGATGRYVRLYSRGNTVNSMNHYVEVEVFGKPAE